MRRVVAASLLAFAIMPVHAQTAGPIPIMVPHYGTSVGETPMITAPSAMPLTSVPAPQPLPPLGSVPFVDTGTPLPVIRRPKR